VATIVPQYLRACADWSVPRRDDARPLRRRWGAPTPKLIFPLRCLEHRVRSVESALDQEKRTADELRQRAERSEQSPRGPAQELQGIRDELHVIRESLAWKTVLHLRTGKDWLLPHRSLRRRLYDQGLEALKSRRLVSARLVAAIERAVRALGAMDDPDAPIVPAPERQPMVADVSTHPAPRARRAGRRPAQQLTVRCASSSPTSDSCGRLGADATTASSADRAAEACRSTRTPARWPCARGACAG